MWIEFLAKVFLLLTIFFLPIETRWIFDHGVSSGKAMNYANGSVYVLDVLLFFSILFTFWQRLLKPRHAAHTTDFFQRGGFGLIILLGFGFIAMSTIAEADDRKAALFALWRLWEGIALWWVVQQSPLRPRMMVAVFVVSAVFESLWGIEQFFFQIVPASTILGEAFHSAFQIGDSVIQASGGRFLRAYGTLSHPNVLGGFLAAAFFFVSALLMQRQKDESNQTKVFHYMAWGGLILLLFGLFVSFSRSAWLGVLGGLIITAVWTSFFYPRVRRVAVGIVLVFALCVGVFGAVFPEGFARFVSQDPLETLSVSERAREYRDVQQIVRSTPITGIGIGQYPRALIDVHPDFSAEKIHPIHNVYALVFSELGILGFFVFVLILVWHARLVRYTMPVESVWIGGALVCLAVIAFFDHYLWSLHFGALLFWLILGIFHRWVSEKDSP